MAALVGPISDSPDAIKQDRPPKLEGRETRERPPTGLPLALWLGSRTGIKMVAH